MSLSLNKILEEIGDPLSPTLNILKMSYSDIYNSSPETQQQFKQKFQELVDQYGVFFDKVGFEDNAIDFSSVKLEVIILLGETLKKYITSQGV